MYIYIYIYGCLLKDLSQSPSGSREKQIRPSASAVETSRA